jgi:hypothetical protein
MHTPTTMVETARAEALFASMQPTGSRPDRWQADLIIHTTVKAHGGIRGCLLDLATEYGEHPDTAPARMCWALETVDRLYRRRPSAPPPRPDRSGPPCV